VTLPAVVFLSELAQRSVLFTAVLLLLAGFVTGAGMLAWIPVEPSNPVVAAVPDPCLGAQPIAKEASA